MCLEGTTRGGVKIPSELRERGRDSRRGLPCAPTLVFDFSYRSTGGGVLRKRRLEVPQAIMAR